ncbi:MAG: GntR family transcriptional regulator [Gemmatimonadota bacterium]
MARSPWPRVSQTTLADQAYKAIRARILSGDLALGEFIREQEVSGALGVSRTPVREALGRLASEGFLERIPHRGFRVPEERWDSLLELYPIVSTLELLAGRLALPLLTADDIQRLKAINGQMSAERDGGDVRKLIELNNQFHHLICRRSGNQRLSELLDDLRSQLSRLELWYYSQPLRTEESVSEHDELIRAIESGQLERALDLLEHNMGLTYRRLQEDQEGSQDDSPIRAVSTPA